MVFSVVVSRLRLPAIFAVGRARLRLCFYTKIRRQSFHTAWVINGSGPVTSAGPLCSQQQTSSAAQPCPFCANKRHRLLFDHLDFSVPPNHFAVLSAIDLALAVSRISQRTR